MIRYLQIWRNLGGNRPRLLRSAELQIWSIIWDHATSTIDLRARLRETLSNLTEDVSRSTEREALNWFSESEYQILSYRKPRELKLQLETLLAIEPNTGSLTFGENLPGVELRPIPLEEEEEEEEEGDYEGLGGEESGQEISGGIDRITEAEAERPRVSWPIVNNAGVVGDGMSGKDVAGAQGMDEGADFPMEESSPLSELMEECAPNFGDREQGIHDRDLDSAQDEDAQASQGIDKGLHSNNSKGEDAPSVLGSRRAQSTALELMIIPDTRHPEPRRSSRIPLAKPQSPKAPASSKFSRPLKRKANGKGKGKKKLPHTEGKKETSTTRSTLFTASVIPPNHEVINIVDDEVCLQYG